MNVTAWRAFAASSSGPSAGPAECSRGARPTTASVADGVAPTLAHYADPTPQALVLTAIVINFAMTALLLVVILAARGSTGTDHVDGAE